MAGQYTLAGLGQRCWRKTVVGKVLALDRRESVLHLPLCDCHLASSWPVPLPVQTTPRSGQIQSRTMSVEGRFNTRNPAVKRLLQVGSPG